jgi:hypothetical protein
MEIEVSSSIPPSTVDLEERNKDQVRVRRKTLKVVLEQCQRALELLNNADGLTMTGIPAERNPRKWSRRRAETAHQLPLAIKKPTR